MNFAAVGAFTNAWRNTEEINITSSFADVKKRGEMAVLTN